MESSTERCVRAARIQIIRQQEKAKSGSIKFEYDSCQGNDVSTECKFTNFDIKSKSEGIFNANLLHSTIS
jgi:hypothetical protein